MQTGRKWLAALAAIQGLHHAMLEKDRKIEKQAERMCAR